jgi:hypothetical protein
MALLNRLEHLPVTFIADARIALLELREALSAYAQGREYQPIDPFVGRFDETIAVEGMLSSRFLLNFGIAETVFLLWTEDPKIFDAYHRDIPKLRQVVSSDRALTRPPTLSAHFSEAITRDLTLYSLPTPPGGVEAFATWIYTVPWRCPSQRLSYELYHSLRMNRGDRPKPSDFGDFYHLHCLPYVDLATADRRMRTYVKRVSTRLGIEYGRKLFGNIAELLPAFTVKRCEG